MSHPEPSDRAAARPREPLWTRDYLILLWSNLSLFTAFQMLLPTLPVYVQRLGGTDAAVGAVMAVFTFASVAIRPFTGAALDIYGRRGLLLLGLTLFGLSVLGFNWTQAVPVILAVRFVQGLGFGVNTTAYGTVAADAVPSSRLAEGMGYYGLAGSLAMAIAPALGLWIIERWGFTTLFVTSGALTGMAIFAATLIRYRPVTGQSASPRPRLALLERAAVRPSLVVFFITMAYGTIVSFLALHAARQGIANIGPFFAVYALSAVLTRPAAGVLADRRGYPIVMVPGLILLAVAMPLIGIARTLPAFIVAAIPIGIGMGAVQPSVQALCVRGLPPARRGAANGTYYSFFDLGIAVGSALGGLVAGRLGYGTMFVLGSVPGTVAVVLYLIFERSPGAGRVIG